MTQTQTPTSPSTAASEWREKRRKRRQQQQQQQLKQENELELTSNIGNNEHDGESSTYVPFISAAKRLRMEREAVLLSATTSGDGDYNNTTNDSTTSRQMKSKSRKLLASLGSSTTTTKTSRTVKTEDKENNDDDNQSSQKPTNSSQSSTHEAQSLLDTATTLASTLTESERAALAHKTEETRILREASQIQTNALQAATEVASGLTYTTPMRTTWTPPRHFLHASPESHDETRRKWHILLEGEDCPPPLKSFADMKFPHSIVKALKEKNIRRPTPIQMQGLPVALAGRDMVGIAFTGSGKTMTFALPLLMVSWEEERRMPLRGGEGPVGFILAPSRELARQTFEAVRALAAAAGESGLDRVGGRYAGVDIRCALLIGGEDPKQQMELFRSRGVHAVVATPGRFRDFLKRKRITLDICRYCCLDEADRMLDLGFDEEVSEIMNFFNHQRQTLLFSATFPQKFRDFAKATLVKPIVVNVGRAGAANLDVIQEVEYVKDEAKIVYLLECLQKTAPPVIIFCEKQKDVDDIHEYLLLKGVEAVSIHGGKDQEERNEAIQCYKDGTKDVLVATDVAAKGLDFSDIQHVINFDMPSEIENYVHRIGRTGRCGKTGVATTFINKSCEEMTLLDLKHLLKEAQQRIPPVLMIMDDPLEMAGGVQVDSATGARGCAFCGGLGHSVVDCPKIDKDARRVAGGHKDHLAQGQAAGFGGGDNW